MKTCPSCQNQCASNARTCPKCGHTFTTGSGIFVAVIVALGIAALLGLCSRR